MFLKPQMDIGNPQCNAELNRKVGKSVCTHVCTTCEGFFWETRRSFFLGISVVLFNIMTGFSSQYCRGYT